MRISSILSTLRSGKTGLVLLLATAIVAAAGTIATPPQAKAFLILIGGERAAAVAGAIGIIDVYHGPVFVTLMSLVAVNVALCTWHRLPLRSLVSAECSASNRRRLTVALDAGMHLSIVVVLAGAAVKALFGFEGTKNMYVGVPEAQIFDWRSGSDVPLGFDLLVEELKMSYYPALAKIGVTEKATGIPVELLTVRENAGAGSSDGSLLLQDMRYDAASSLFEMVAVQGQKADLIRFPKESGGPSNVDVGTYTLSLVAWRRDLREVRGQVAIRERGRIVQQDRLRVNGRMSFRGWNLYLTGWGRDEFGNEFVGIQVTRDPGAVLFWTGSVLFMVCLAAFLPLRHPKESPRP